MSIAGKIDLTVVPQAVHQGWAYVRTSPRANWVALPLPLTIGSHSDNDVYVNAPTMRPVSKVVCADGDSIVVVNTDSLAASPLSELRLFGIEIIGPFTQNPDNLSTLARVFQFTKLFESIAFSSSYFPILQRLLPQQQSRRFALVGFLVAGFAGVLNMGSGSPSANEDLSGRAISATVGNVIEVGINSPGASSSYAGGVTLAFAGASIDASKNHILTIGIGGLDIASEFNIEVNGKYVGEVTAHQNCIDSPCNRDFAIASELWLPNGNTVFIKHNQPNSSYILKNIFLRGMETATAEEQEQVVQLLASAERYYEERHLLTQNIHNAYLAVNEIDQLTATRTGLEAHVARIAITKKAVTEYFKEISADLQFKLQKELRLGHSSQSVSLINEMFKLYPDPTSRQYLMLAQQKKILLEVKK